MSSYRFLLRRTAVRAISATPSKAFLTQPRSIASIAPAALRLRQYNKPLNLFQRRFNSDDAAKTGAVETDAVETPVAETENSAKAASDASIENSSEELVEDAQRQAQPESSSSVSADDSTFPTTQDFENTEKSGPRNPRPVFPEHRLYVGNLFYEVKEPQLQRVFSRFGEISRLQLIYDNRGYSRGFAYIDFKNADDAQAAVDNLNMQVFEGRNLIVQFHREKGSRKVDSRFQPHPPSDTLFIGNLSYDMSDKDINDLFRDIRNVVDVRVAVDRRTGQPRGFCHAEFIDTASATAGKEILSEKVTYGRKIRVDFSDSISSKQKRRNAALQ